METLKELTDALAAAEVDGAILEALPGIIDARVKSGVESETETLRLASDRAVGEAKRLKARLKAFVDGEGNPLGADDIPELLALAEKGRKGAEDQEDYEVLKERHEKPWKKKVKDIEEERDGALGELRRVLLDEQIMDALAKGGIEASRIRIALNHLKSERSYKVEKVNERWQAFEEVGSNAVPLSESMKSFLDSDEAKFFMPASGSSGGGAEGADAPSGGESKEKRFLNIIKGGNATEQSKARKEDPALYDKLKSRNA